MGKKKDKAARESNAAGEGSMDVKSPAKGGNRDGLTDQPSKGKGTPSNDSSVTIEKASKKLQKRASQAYAQANGDMDIDVPVTSASTAAAVNGVQPDLTAMQGDQQSKIKSSSKKRKRHSESGSQAVANGAESEAVNGAAGTQSVGSSQATRGETNSPPKKKKRKNRNKNAEASQATANGDESEGVPASSAPTATGIPAEQAALERAKRKAEKRRQKQAAKDAAAAAATQKAQQGNGAANGVVSRTPGKGSDNIPVPQLANGEDMFVDDAEAAMAALTQAQVQAPASSQAAAPSSPPKRFEAVVVNPSSTSSKKAKSSTKKSRSSTEKKTADKKGKGKAKEPAEEPAKEPLFHPEDDDDDDDEEKDELADDSDEGIPELPPPLSARRAVTFDMETDAEDEAIDPVLRASFKKQKDKETASTKPKGRVSKSTAKSDTSRTLRQRKPTSESAKTAPTSSASSAAGASNVLQSSATGARQDVVDGIKSLGPSSNTPANRELLATKWLSAKDMAKIDGLVYKSGQFSPDEDAAVLQGIEDFKESQGLTDDEISTMIHHKGKKSKVIQSFWQALGEKIVDRPLQSIYHRVKRIFQPDARKGPWSAQEDADLRAAVEQMGEKWEQISARVGRWAPDCRDRYRNYISSNARRTGAWTEDEEKELREAIEEIKLKLGVDMEDDDGESFWTAVAAKLGGKRTRAQCRIKWTDNLKNRIVDMDGKRRRFGRMDSYILVAKLKAHMEQDGIERFSDINWKSLSDDDWKMWSVHVLQKRFKPMHDRAIRGLNNSNASFPEVMAWLVSEQEDIPRAKLLRFLNTKGKSAGSSDVDVDDSQEELDEEEDSPAPAAVQVPTPKASTSKSNSATKKTPIRPTPTASKGKGKATTAKARAKEKTPSSSPPPPATSASARRRSGRLPSARSIVASVPAPAPTSKFRTKEFISESDEEED